MGQRAVSPVMGMVILAGLTAIVGISVFVVGLTVMGGAQSTAETTQAETSMIEFANTANDIAETESGRDSFALSGADDATTWINESAGHVEITLDNGTTSETIADQELGAYRYETSDGTEIAYQGGGVWRRDDGERSEMIDPPSFDYRTSPEPTLTFAITKVIGNATNGGQTTGDLALEDRRSLYPAADRHQNPLPGGELYVDIESQYCEGWESYVSDRTDGSVVEDCTTEGETDTGEIRVELAVPTVQEVEAAVIASKELSPQAGGEGDVRDTVVVPGGKEQVGDDLSVGAVKDRPVDLEETNVSEKVDSCPAFNSSVPSRINGSDSPYCFTEINTSNGDQITIEPDQHVEIILQDGVTITDNNAWIDVDNGTGDNIDIYSGGDVYYSSPTSMGNPDNPAQTRLYTNETATIQGRQTEYYGLIYAPQEHSSKDGTVMIESDADVIGSVLSTTVHIQGDDSTVEWDSGMDGMPVSPAAGENPVYYLHVTENELSVTG